MKWIDLEEKLPNDMQIVIYCDADKKLASIGVYCDSVGFCGEGDAESITHWMPLPDYPVQDGGRDD